METKVYDIGNTVLCDQCNKDFSNSDAKGGFIFGSHAVCPDCEEEFMKGVKQYHEESYIRAKCPKDMSFKEFILKDRNGDNTIKIISW